MLQCVAMCVMVQQFAKEGEKESLQVCRMCPICTKRDLENRPIKVSFAHIFQGGQWPLGNVCKRDLYRSLLPISFHTYIKT